MRQHSLEEVARQAGISAAPVYRDETGSTNADALELAAAGAPAWTVVATGHQTAGRGRMGRSWVSAPGKLLQFSLILRPDLAPDTAGLVPLRAAVDMVDACRGAGVDAWAKWPNDLVVGERKLAGILAETRIEAASIAHLVLGIGVNVSMSEDDFPPEMRARATSLAREGASAGPESLLGEFLLRFFSAVDSGALDLEAYRARCRTLGVQVRATTVEGGVVEGTAVDVDERGGLIVQTPGGRETVAFGEVGHLD